MKKAMECGRPQCRVLAAEMAALKEDNERLREQLAAAKKNSSTSSKPPSSDGPGRRPRGGSSRTASGRKPGKQPGAPETALRLVDDPDERIVVPVPAVCGCGTSLVEAPVTAVRRTRALVSSPLGWSKTSGADSSCRVGRYRANRRCPADGLSSRAAGGSKR